ncbi:MAG TPA: hypothetical protein PLA50_00085, partial [Bacteroidia bacterium]|nr:hypothetical protein [Bacteroidia bacterium]
MDDRTGLILDGYQLLRPLGRGGFGEVWLCRSQAIGDLRAIKLISTEDPAKAAKEHSALTRYRAAAGLDPRHLVSIEHINRNEWALYYVMPLADGPEGGDPESLSWEPLTLDAVIERRRGEEVWFSSGEIIGMISPVLLALQTLLDAGLVHGDVKPANILFFNGATRLADVGLLDDDHLSRTRSGTPVFSAPSWYRGGLPDMYSVATTLYVLLTGNHPDTMGRSAFRWPPPGEASLSPSERNEWVRLHGVVRRAVDEQVSERYLDFSTMLDAVRGTPGVEPFPIRQRRPHGAMAGLWTGLVQRSANQRMRSGRMIHAAYRRAVQWGKNHHQLLIFVVIVLMNITIKSVDSFVSASQRRAVEVARQSDRNLDLLARANRSFLAEILDTLKNGMPASGSIGEWGQLIAQISKRGVTDPELIPTVIIYFPNRT